MITAGISLIGVLFSFLSVKKMGKQIEIQKNQWEYSHKPIFRIIKCHDVMRDQRWEFIIENFNDVFHRIDSVSFSSDEVNVSEFRQGYLKLSSTSDEEYTGLSFMLSPLVITYVNGTIQLRGTDLVGNKFICNSPPIRFNYGDIVDQADFNKVFFEFIK